MSFDGIENLPIVLISSVDSKAADSIISELIDDKEAASEDSSAGRVWRLTNKYYTAQVLLLPAPDPPAPAPALAAAPDAHVIYLTEAECACDATAAALLERRAAGAGGGAAGVRLALCAAAGEPPALRAAAARRRYELVALGDVGGWRRARDALHAHTWPGLRRVGGGGGDGGGGEEQSAEAFAAALATLAAARELPAAARRERAEALLGVFARALGLGDELDPGAL